MLIVVHWSVFDRPARAGASRRETGASRLDSGSHFRRYAHDQGTRQPSLYIQWTSMDIRRIHHAPSMNIQWTFNEHSMTFNEHSMDILTLYMLYSPKQQSRLSKDYNPPADGVNTTATTTDTSLHIYLRHGCMSILKHKLCFFATPIRKGTKNGTRYGHTYLPSSQW